jgi:acyl-CoA synthetase (AMP-forming)/AMP-acid ligase II
MTASDDSLFPTSKYSSNQSSHIRPISMSQGANNIYEAVFGEANRRDNNSTLAVAVVDLGKSNDPITYAQLQALVDNTRLSSAIKTGEKVALVMPNSLELVVGLFATWAQGAATAPLNPSYTSIEFRVSDNSMYWSTRY